MESFVIYILDNNVLYSQWCLSGLVIYTLQLTIIGMHLQIYFSLGAYCCHILSSYNKLHSHLLL
jgi:hypothetical protein